MLRQLGLLNTPTAPLQRCKTTPNECPGYDTKQSDGEAPVILELWGIQSFPSRLTKTKELILPYYLPVARRRTIRFVPNLRVFLLCEMQSVSSSIWTCVIVSISYNDNHYTTGTSHFFPKTGCYIKVKVPSLP